MTMGRQNVTLSIDKSLLKKAKMIAAREDKSLSELLRESLEVRIKQATGYKNAQTRQLRILKKGYDLGSKGKLDIAREEIHARR
jgi:hypothetical protein